MEQSVIVEMTTDELKERLEDEQGMLVKMKLNHAVSPIESTVKLGATKRNVARLKTELRKRRTEESSNN